MKHIIKNVSPLGALDVPLLGRVVGAGEEVEVTPEQAERLLRQSIWEQVAPKPDKSSDEPKPNSATTVEAKQVKQ